MIGLSLYRCVREIAENKVALDVVEKIISRTSAKTDEEWIITLDAYKESYWPNCADKAVKIVAELRQAGKIEQSLLTRGKAPDIVATGGIWVRSESEIKWRR